MRYVVCGHYGVDVSKANFGPFPYFKYYSLVKPNHLKSDIFVSPFIFTEDSLKANEKGGEDELQFSGPRLISCNVQLQSPLVNKTTSGQQLLVLLSG